MSEASRAAHGWKTPGPGLPATLRRADAADLPAPRLDGHRHALRADLLQEPEGQSESGLRGQDVGVTQVDDPLWLVTFVDYDLGYFDDETCRLEPIANPFGPKVLPMSPE